MHLAASLLREAGMLIREAADKTGYGLETAFRRAFGVTGDEAQVGRRWSLTQ
jgi:hypothetical protein